MNLKSFLLLSGLVLCLGVSLGNAQGTLRGTVTDASTRDALTGTNILLTSETGSLSRGANSGLDGSYQFNNLPAGTYTARISYVGFVDQTITGITIVSGQTTTLDVALSPGVSLNPVVISASKAQEKVTDAPASIQVVTSRDIRNVSTATATDYVKGLTAVDVAQQGVASQTVVTRGFNNIFSGSLLVLTDNRITHIPSLRANALHFIPQTNEDIETVELVLGPGAALYGPNTNSGVMHMLTKSPFSSTGTSVGLFGGNQSFMKAQFRTAHNFSDRVGIKLSGQYVQASEFELDPNNPYRLQETQARSSYLANGGPGGTPGDPLSERGRRIGIRDYDIEKLGIDSRLDYRINDDFTMILNAGFNRSNNIDLTGLGASQAVDWTYSFAQARFLYKNLFLQAFMNMSNSGDTYIIPTGNSIVDKSKLFVTQAQHTMDWSRFNFVYGLDFIRTMPETDGTVNGQYEDDDTYQEIGGYLQAKYRLSDKFDLLGSFRIDKHSELADPVFSPRAAIVFKPFASHTFRATYNRSFSTPSSNNLFLDLLARQNSVFPGYNGTGFLDIRAQGVPSSGFSFMRGGNGLPVWQLNLPAVAPGQPTSNLELDTANLSALHWAVLRNVLNGAVQQNPNIPAPIKGLPWGTAGNPGTGGLPSIGMLLFNPSNGALVSDVTDINRIGPTTYNTFEVGYKGIINNKLLLSADVYYTIAQNFVGPLLVETPTVNMNPTQLGTYLVTFMMQNGVDQPTAEAVAGGIVPSFARIPLGVVTPQEAFDPNAVMLTYRNFGEISYFGADFGFEYLLNDTYRVMGNYSFVGEDRWLEVDGNKDFNIMLNAPTNKFMLGLGYDNRALGLDAGLKFRYVGGFPIESGIYNTYEKTVSESGEFVYSNPRVLTEMPGYYTVDLNLGYDVRQVRGLRLSATVNNLTNNAKPQFAGTPDIGLFAIAGLTYSF